MSKKIGLYGAMGLLAQERNQANCYNGYAWPLRMICFKNGSSALPPFPNRSNKNYNYIDTLKHKTFSRIGGPKHWQIFPSLAGGNVWFLG